jgi:hypothetical protein
MASQLATSKLILDVRIFKVSNILVLPRYISMAYLAGKDCHLCCLTLEGRPVNLPEVWYYISPFLFITSNVFKLWLS